MTNYCSLCGNEEVALANTIGELCQPFIQGPLQDAKLAYDYVSSFWGKCCGGLSSDISFGRTLAERICKFNAGTHLYLHPHGYGESSYAIEESLEHEPVITVDCGIHFGQTGATCYWVFDNDKIDTHSEPLDGGPVPYAQDGESFLKQLARILETAAEQAYMSDHAQCAECGGIYYMPNGPCCEGGDPEGDEEDYDKCGNCEHTREQHIGNCTLCDCSQWGEDSYVPDDSDDAHERAHETGSATLVTREDCEQCQQEQLMNDGDVGIMTGAE